MFGLAYHYGSASRDTPPCVIFGVLATFITVALLVTAAVTLCDVFERESKITSEAVDKLIGQFSRLRGRH